MNPLKPHTLRKMESRKRESLRSQSGFSTRRVVCAVLLFLVGLFLAMLSFAVDQGFTLSINDVTLTEDSCQNTSFVFTVTLSHLGVQPVTVNYATQDGAAVANKDYVPVTGTLSFTHDMPPNGPHGSYLATITVPLGNYVRSAGTNDARSFSVILSGATNATISRAQGVGTLTNAALSCTPPQNGVCFVNFCGATTSCKSVNRSATAEPYCQLAGIGNYSGSPDPNFGSCHYLAGLWVNTSGDGISDAAKAQGFIDVNANGVYDPGIDVPLPGADPNHADVYLHYDYMVAAGDHDHNPPAQAIQWMVDAFAAHGVTLHIDPVHNAIPEAGQKVVTNQNSGPPNFSLDPACAGDASTGGAVSTLALLQQYLPGNMKLAYHYMVFAHYSTCPDAAHCSACAASSESTCISGSSTGPPPFGALGDAQINGNKAIVSLGGFVDAHVPIPLETWAGVTMHELGHNFGLVHGGIPSSGADCSNQKPNYVSVMNYSFTTAGIPLAAAPGDPFPKSCVTDADCPAPAHCSGPNGSNPNTCVRIDYSSVLLPDLDENHLNETVGLNISPNSTDLSVFYTNGGITTVFAPTNGSPIDWNQDSIIEINACADISGMSIRSCGNLPTLLGANPDWANLNFYFQCTTNFGQ